MVHQVIKNRMVLFPLPSALLSSSVKLDQQSNSSLILLYRSNVFNATNCNLSISVSSFFFARRESWIFPSLPFTSRGLDAKRWAEKKTWKHPDPWLSPTWLCSWMDKCVNKHGKNRTGCIYHGAVTTFCFFIACYFLMLFLWWYK